MKRTRDDIAKAFAIQRKFLSASCNAYDSGQKYEALRLASVVFTLLHDGGKNSQSVFSHMGLKNKISFVSTSRMTAIPPDGTVWRITPMLELERYEGRGVEFVPLCTYYERHQTNFFSRSLKFHDWWEKDPVFYQAGRILTRKKLVFALRNQEGGSHYDSELSDPNYTPMLERIAMFSCGHGLNLIDDLELATMRQVAEEVRLTMLATWGIQDEDMPKVEIVALSDIIDKKR
jgi:hypothetical protein